MRKLLLILLLIVPGVLKPDELALARSWLADAPFVDGKLSAGALRTFLAEHIAKECRTEKAKYDALRMFEGRVLPFDEVPWRYAGREQGGEVERLSLSYFLSYPPPTDINPNTPELFVTPSVSVGPA